MKKFVNFIIEVRREAQKVIWPDKKTVINTTVIVVVSVILFSMLFLVIDSLSYKIVSYFSGLGI